MTERAAGLMRTGERTGESAPAERATILPWFGPMLEASCGPVFEREVLPVVPEFEHAGSRGGFALDLLSEYVQGNRDSDHRGPRWPQG